MNLKYPSTFIAKEDCRVVAAAAVEKFNSWSYVVSVSKIKLLIGKKNPVNEIEL